MSTWQELLRQRSITSLEALAERFGPEHFPPAHRARLRQAAENFEFRISPPMVDLIKSPDDPIWRQYIPTIQELDVVDGIVDSLAEDRDSPVPTHRAAPRTRVAAARTRDRAPRHAESAAAQLRARLLSPAPVR